MENLNSELQSRRAVVLILTVVSTLSTTAAAIAPFVVYA